MLEGLLNAIVSLLLKLANYVPPAPSTRTDSDARVTIEELCDTLQKNTTAVKQLQEQIYTTLITPFTTLFIPHATYADAARMRNNSAIKV